MPCRPCRLPVLFTTSQDLKNNWGRVQSEVDVPAVRELFKAVDWIGVSAYAGLPRFPSVADLETSLKLVDQEMKMFGMDLKGLGKEIIYSEYGEHNP
jgi:hypothetical protein